MRLISLDDETPPRLLAAWHALAAATDVELEPHVPPGPIEELLVNARSDEGTRRATWLMVDADTETDADADAGTETDADAGSVIGFARLNLPLLDNTHLANLDVRVDAERRRAGVGAALTRVAALAAHDAGRRTVLVEAVEGSAGDAACAALRGAPALGSMSCSLRLADLDRSVVDRSIKRRGERAGDYSLVRWIGACPDDRLEAFAQLREAMSTAPMGDLDMTVEWTPASIRVSEREHALCGRENLVLCALHDATGDLVALTHVLVPTGRPTLAIQEDTVVRPDHRNRGLGRWIKAEMLDWLATEQPQLEIIITWNAAENAAMRAINTELGFVPDAAWTEWQFSTSDLLAELARRATDPR